MNKFLGCVVAAALACASSAFGQSTWSGAQVFQGASTFQNSLTLSPPNLSGTPGSAGAGGLLVSSYQLTDNATAGSGTATNAYFHVIQQPFLAASNTSVVTTTACTLCLIGAPIKGTNDTATNAIGLYVAGGTVGAHTNAYAARFDAPAGATSNYSAYLNGPFTIGGTSDALTNTIDNSTVTHTLSLGAGTTAAGQTLTLNIGTSQTSTGVNAITIGTSGGASSLTLTSGTGNTLLSGAATTSYTIGTAAHTGSITVGNSTAGDTVNISTGAIASGTNAINIGTGGSSTAVETITLGSSLQNARSGIRNQSSRNILSNKPVASPDCAGATLNLTVMQFLDAAAFTCATAQTVNYPTWQGASGIVQNLPGTPAVGDIIFAPLGVATAANAITIGAGTGGTLRGVPTTIVANGTRQQMCRLTAVTSGSETADCWIIGL